MKKRNFILILMTLLLAIGVLSGCTNEVKAVGFYVDRTAIPEEVALGEEIDFTKLKVVGQYEDGTEKVLKRGREGFSFDKGTYRSDFVGKHEMTVFFKNFEPFIFFVTVREEE